MVAGHQLIQNDVNISFRTLCLQFSEPSFGPYLRVGINKKLELGMGQNDRSDISAIENGTIETIGNISGEIMLTSLQCIPHSIHGRNDRSHIANSIGADFSIFGQGKIKFFRSIFSNLRCNFGIAVTCAQQAEPNAAIKTAGIEMPQI